VIRAILAHDAYWGIGKDGNLPWPKNVDDLAWFKECTNAQAVVMGRKTWESLPKKPLPNRINLVITSTSMEHYNPRPHGTYSGKDVCRILKDVIEARYGGIDDIWIIGGAQLVESCLPVIEELWLNDVGGDYHCDTFLPKRKITAQFEPGSVEIKSFGIITKWTRRKDAAVS
jgi:dihydrofolate reductase